MTEPPKRGHRHTAGAAGAGASTAPEDLPSRTARDCRAGWRSSKSLAKTCKSGSHRPVALGSRIGSSMPKAYWVVTYRSVSDPQKLATYAERAAAAIAPFGARFLAMSRRLSLSNSKWVVGLSCPWGLPMHHSGSRSWRRRDHIPAILDNRRRP